VPQAAYRSCRGAVHVTDRAGVESISCKLSLRPHAAFQLYAAWSAV